MSVCIRVLGLAHSANSCEEADEPVASVKPARPANELFVKIFAFEMLWEDTASSRDTAQDTSSSNLCSATARDGAAGHRTKQ
jgi:hypothetical protein